MDSMPNDYLVQLNRFTKVTSQQIYPTIDPARPELSLAGKVAVVTGASRGIGARGIAPSFAKAGAKAIVLLATNAEKLAGVEAELHAINPNVETLVSTIKLTDLAAVDGLFSTIKERWGHADILVNNAAVNVGPEKIHEVDPEVWWSNYEIDVRGPFLLMRAFIRTLPDPTSSPATIINIVSGAAYSVIEGMHGYSTAKLALLQLGTHMAQMYPAINIVSVNPGFVDTEALLPIFRRFDLDSPELVGGVSTWVAARHDEAKFMSGRFMTANWSVDELLARKDEIVREALLVVKLNATLGKEQFEE